MNSKEETLQIYDQIIATNDKFKRKGKTVPYTSANGYMFTLFNKENQIGFRLSKEDQKAFIEKYDSGPFRSYGAIMRDYVIIPESLYNNMDVLSYYLEKSYQFVMSLKPK